MFALINGKTSKLFLFFLLSKKNVLKKLRQHNQKEEEEKDRKTFTKNDEENDCENFTDISFESALLIFAHHKINKIIKKQREKKNRKI